MPVGTSFENSAMKTSFSLSSLQAPEILTPEREIKMRQFNSLTKKRVKSPNVRKSWGSTTSSDHRDEFWLSLQENYNYIMDNNLIDKCQEVKSDICLDRKERERTLDGFIAEYSKLYTLIDSVQEMIYGKEENITDKAIRLQCQSLVLENSPLMNLLNERASQLVQSHPEVQEEVTWRLGHLNSKWDTISSILGATECGLCEQETCLDLDHEIKCLRKWIKTMEQVLQPLDLKTKYSKTEIEAKALELKVLHRDIENHGKIVSSVVKLCKKSDASCNRANVRRIANGLERRWHLLFLSSLEWQCYLDTLTVRENSKNQNYSSDSDSDFNFEPVNKYPRLSSREYLHRSKEKIFKENAVEFSDDKGNKEEVMSTNGIPRNVQQNGLDLLDSTVKLLGSEDHFTHSNRKGPNLATYYFKHPDTDSDMEKVERNSIVIEGAQEETSEDEWVYNKNEEKNEIDLKENTTEPPKKLIPEETIKRLVQKAEELVSPDQTKKHGRLHTFNKSRVKQWLFNKRPEDSCDASGEDEERESQMSEDIDDSTATYKANASYDSHNTSFNDLNSSESTPKVILRQRKNNGNRPWSVSCISQLELQNGMAEFSHSTSESALHNITPKKMNDFNNTCSTQTMTLAGNNSTSSTIEDSNTILPEEKTSPSRRRRLKMRRKCSHKYQCSKSDDRRTNNRLFKSSSYSGCPNAMNQQNERQTSSDPPSMSVHSLGKYDTTSGAETDDSFGRRIPSFKVGLKTHYLSAEIRDSSPGKSSLNTAEEQSSSLSEQAWDSYQEKYLSEAYSEAHDSDAARRLLEFGEDYHNFIDSQSIDSQSDWSTNPDFSPTFRRRTLPLMTQDIIECDTDSDTESLRKFINSSREHLHYTKEIHQQQVQLGLGQYLEANNISVMLANCERHIDLLKHLESSGDFVSKEDKKAATELQDLWLDLKNSVMILQEYRNLQKDILNLKNSLNSIVVPDAANILYVDDLEKEVCKYEKLLADIKELKKKLFDLNILVHRFGVENKEYNSSHLKNDISQLYEAWESLNEKTSDRLSQLQALLEKWKTLENRLDQLHGDLRSDEKTLRLLDSALKGGTLSEQTAIYVRDVAKLLSETNAAKGCTIPELFTEGSWSDSGISDEGSEHEIGERERRLAAIRRLVRQLEVVLSPDSDARVQMANRLNSAEEELRELQKQCRLLIVRSATCTMSFIASSNGEKTGGETKETKGKDGGGDPDHDSGITSWFRRAVRASVPFQLVLVTILCIAWLLEPQCCDNMNNYAWSMSPKLRYINGPPPI